MLTEGVPAAMIENVGRMAGMPVGPLSLNDEVARRSRLEDPQGDRSRSRRRRDRSAAEGAARGDGGKARAATAARTARAFTTIRRTGRNGCGRASPTCRRPSSIPTRSTSRSSSSGCWRSRRSNRRAASRRAWSPTCARPMSARSSASALRRSPAARISYIDGMGAKAFVEHVQPAGEEIRRPFQAGEDPARHGQDRRNVLSALPAGKTEGRVIVSRCIPRYRSFDFGHHGA